MFLLIESFFSCKLLKLKFTLYNPDVYKEYRKESLVENRLTSKQQFSMCSRNILMTCIV